MRAYLRTFGCRANHYDTERVRARLVASGWAIVDDGADADVAIFNSCTVTTAAESDLRSAVRRTAARGPDVQTIVMGCAAAVDDGTIAALPSVRAVVPRADWQDVAAALGLDAQVDPDDAPAEQTATRAVLRVQDGCDEHCTFCLTRVARGAQRSRTIDAIVDEATALAAHHVEVVITGTHIGTYGADIGTSLGVLVERLVRELPAVRFRMSSIEATEVDDRLRTLLRDAPMHVAPFLHAPLQSGSDRILRRMGRHWYTAAQYVDAVERIVADRPVFGLAADVIAGFPGETEDDHSATMRLVERLPFTALHVFPYSARPGTPATRLDDAVPSATIARRARELRELGAARGAAYRARRVGGSADVVVTGSAARREGVTGDYLFYPVDAAIPRGTRFTGVVPA